MLPHTVSVPPPLPSLPPRPLLDASSHLSQTWVEQADEAAATAQVKSQATSALALALINRIPQRNIGQDALVAADALSNFCPVAVSGSSNSRFTLIVDV